MLLSEWNIDEAKAVWREEALEEGREQGLEQGLEEGYGEIVKNALAKGYSVKAISELTGLDIDTITRLAHNLKTL
jgi:predicted transposase/invertase (TIGR01784 family)